MGVGAVQRFGKVFPGAVQNKMLFVGVKSGNDFVLQLDQIVQIIVIKFFNSKSFP